jgi:hypothetical protein
LVLALGLEDGAVGHVAGIDVQADGDGVVAGVADGVVLVGRDQAAGGAGAGLDGPDRLEAVQVAVVGQALVLDHFQGAAPHAFDTPHATVVVDGGALARAPGHGHHAVAELVAVVQLAAGVAVLGGLEDAVGQGDFLVADQLAEAIAQAVGDGGRGALGNGFVDGADELLTAGKFRSEHGGLGKSGLADNPYLSTNGLKPG